MPKYADYIKRIEIDSLWSGKRHILWELNPGVNILSGINGVGKSTILNKVVRGLVAGGEFPSHMLKGVRLEVVPEDAKWIRYDVIRSLDSPVLDLDTMAHVDTRISSALDFQLYHLQRKYLDYQVNIGNRMIAELQAGHTDAAQQLSLPSSCRCPSSASRISSTTCSRIQARRLSVRRMRSASRRSERRWCPISSRVVRSRCWPSC